MDEVELKIVGMAIRQTVISLNNFVAELVVALGRKVLI